LWRRFDGILGLAYDTISVNGIVPPVYEMIKGKMLDNPVFAFRMGSSEADGGEATFGGVDDSAYTGKIHYVPVRRKAYWEVEIEKVQFGDDVLELENTGAAIDTGTSLIVTPVDVAEMLNTQIGAKKSWNGQYTVDCAKVPDLPDLSFFFDGKAHRLHPEPPGHVRVRVHGHGHQPPWRRPLDRRRRFPSQVLHRLRPRQGCCRLCDVEVRKDRMR
jgi:saccharopepsin